MKRKQKLKLSYDALMTCYPFVASDLDGEIWTTISELEEYQVSTFGRVKSLKWGKQKILRPRLDRNGYLAVRFCQGKKQYIRSVHRLVAENFIPNPDNKPEVNHLHGQFNNYVGCLEWTTHSENMQYSYDAGGRTGPCGEHNGQAKLTSEQVLYIRENTENLTQKQLGKLFGVTKTAIGSIQRGRTWKSVGGKILKENGNRKIHSKTRRQIRKIYKTGRYSQRELGKMFGVHQMTISRIINEK